MGAGAEDVPEVRHPHPLTRHGSQRHAGEAPTGGGGVLPEQGGNTAGRRSHGRGYDHGGWTVELGD